MSRARRNVRTLVLGLLGPAIAMTAMGQPAAAAAPADFSGVWVVEKPSREIRTRNGSAPPLLPASLEIYRERKAQAAAGDLSFDEVETKCAMPGLPRILAMPYPFQIFQSALRVAFVYEFNHNFRSVDITSAPPTAEWGTGYGKGAASFAGDRLLIRTGGLAGDSFLDAVGMPHSENLNITETYRLLDGGKRLAVDLRIDDPATFSSPWETSITFRRLADYHLREDVCLDRKADGEPAIDWQRSSN